MYVIKIGGSVVDSPAMLASVIARCAALSEPFVLVHGGGTVATKLAEELGIEQTMIDGRRVTDAATLRVVTMAYGGLVNKNVVAQLQACGCSCIGVTGADADLVRATKRSHPTIDYGYVGDVTHVNTDVLQLLLDIGMSVVVAPLTHDGHGSLLNTNADTMAAEIAIAMKHRNVKLRYVFELPGLMTDVGRPDTLLDMVDADLVEVFSREGVITKGMLPKISNALRAAQHGVHVMIQHASALGTDVGTVVV